MIPGDFVPFVSIMVAGVLLPVLIARLFNWAMELI